MIDPVASAVASVLLCVAVWEARLTPQKCSAHEMRPGELADSERYTRALAASARCWRCLLLAVRAHVVYWWRGGGG